MKFEEALGMFVRYLEANDRSRKTVYGYQSDLRSFNKFYQELYNAEWYPEDTLTDDIDLFLLQLQKLGKEPATRNRILSTMKSFFKYLFGRALCPNNPTLSVPNIRYKKKEKSCLTTDEFKELIAAIEHPVLRLATETLWYTGVRIGELVHLTVGDLDFKKQEIHVVGKGMDERSVPMNPLLKEKLEEYKNEFRASASQYDRFFATDGSGGLSASYYNKVLFDATKKLGWNKKVTAHVFRHTFTTNLVEAGVHPMVIEKLLGHRSFDVTLIYAHPRITTLLGAVEAL